MGRYESELHTLCDAARWPEVRSILTSLLEAEHAASVGVIEAGGVGGGGNGDGREKHEGHQHPHPHTQHEGHAPPRPDKKSTHRASIAPTATTAPESDRHTAPTEASERHTNHTASIYTRSVDVSDHDSNSSSSEDWFDEEDLGCSYEEILPGERRSAYNDFSERSGEDYMQQQQQHPQQQPQPQQQQQPWQREGPTQEAASPPSSTHGNDEGSHCSVHSTPINGLSPARLASLKHQLTSREGPNKWTPLLIACVRAPPPVIQLLLRPCPAACTIPDRNGNLPLHVASCRRRSGPRDDDVKGRDIEVPGAHCGEKSSGHGRRRRDRDATPVVHNRYGKPPTRNDAQPNDVRRVLHLLIASHPEALATTNRWRQTPLHALFDSRSTGRAEERADGMGAVDALLGNATTGGLRTSTGSSQLDPILDAPAPDEATDETKSATIMSAVRRSLRARDARGRLPLHAAALCPWTTASMLRGIVDAFPPAAWMPVLPPFDAGGGGGSSVTSYEWDVTRNAVLPEEDAREGEMDGNTYSEGLFPKTGGCYGKDLAVHLLHRRFLSPPPAAGRSNDGSIDDPDAWTRGTLRSEDASVFLTEDRCGAVEALLEPLAAAAGQKDNLEARLACAATGSGGAKHATTGAAPSARDGDDPGASLRSVHSAPSLASGTMLPLHIAAIHGASYDILAGLCGAHPEGALTPLATPLHPDRTNVLPIELFEEGRAGHEVNGASDEEFPSLSAEYFRRSDLLFSYFPEAVSSKGAVYCHDEARLERFEVLIKEEATVGDNDGILSDMAGSVWQFLCRSAGDPSHKSSTKSRASKPNFGAYIGSILDGLEPEMVLRLNFLRTVSVSEGVRVPPLANGRTILEEARERAPNGSMGQMLGEHFFHSSMLSFLDAGDALAYSSTCRRARARGVRRLPRLPKRSDADEGAQSTNEAMEDRGEWRMTPDDFASETSSQREEREGKVSLPWQKIELPFVPSCTHTVTVSCDIVYKRWRDEDESDDDSAIECDGGGLLVLREDAMRASAQPELVVASDPAKATNSESPNPEGDEDQRPPNEQNDQSAHVSFSFNHFPGHSYTLWYYGSEGHSLSVTNLSVRQLVYSCDYNGDNPLRVLLSGGDNPSNLQEQIFALVAAGFGRDLPVHYALKVGVLERALRCLIEASPASLLDTDSDRRTPLHAALSGSGMPYLGILQALLVGQGANAAHLKDSSGKLPIHLAAEHGCNEALLRVLVDIYADGCYRRTDEGDLPIHLLVRSGSATQTTVELLLRPIMNSPTICAYPGSSGVNLPLHIAAENRCKYNILECLLSSYGEAAQVQRHLQSADTTKTEAGGRQSKKNAPKYALEIFEEGRGKDDATSNLDKTVGAAKDDATQKALGQADFNLRSDLIFVHNPNVPKSIRPYLTTYYRDEKDRIERLAAVVKREAVQCSKKKINDEKKGGESPKLTEMARLAWCWMCSNDLYAAVVSDIARSLPVEAVRFLSLTENPKSEPVSDIPIKDCSAPRCALILKSRLSFLGRYVLERDRAPLHKSESCVILRAKDIGAMESYLSIQTLLSDADPDIDDYSHGCGSVYAITGNSIEVDRFTHFARKIGVDQSQAIDEIEKLLHVSSALDESLPSDAPEEQEKPNLRAGVGKTAFTKFCQLHAIDDTGCRSVVIKFMKNKQSFELEWQGRDILRESGNSTYVVPILNHFSFEGGNKGDGGRGEGDSNDIFGEEPPSIDLSGLPYGIVMPTAKSDLRETIHREGISSENLRKDAHRVGKALKALHEQGIAHLNLQLQNVLQFGNRIVLSDFGSALFIKSIDGLNAIGGTSIKLCPGILPPEMIAKIDLANRDSFDQLMRYWKYVHADANNLKALTPDERQVISQFIQSSSESLREKVKADGQENDNWKHSISALLETIQFQDLPHALSKCSSLKQFCTVYGRMSQNYVLWESVIRPRVDEENQSVYMIKCYEDRSEYPPRDAASLPYNLIPPSEKVDVWIFGIFLYELCSGGNPFHVGYQGQLRGVSAYAKLYGWDRNAVEQNVKEHIEDPLAQDLLCQILVPAEERLPTIDAVLMHPFFSPKSAEAERFLERHEEMQLLRDVTVSIRKVSKSVSYMLDDSMEKYVTLGFATDQIAFPTCLVVLPYEVNIDESTRRPVAPAKSRIISCAVNLGKCLLEINKATARLSFWLMMSGRISGSDGDAFKAQLQDWLKRARHQSCASIAREIVNDLGCGMNYSMICEEVLAFDGSISQAKSYMRDPVRAARKAIKRNSDELTDLYQTLAHLYLVDEFTLLPVCSSERSTQVGSTYSMQLQPDPKLIANVLLPFMNIVTMKALASDGFLGLANLLGLPPQLGIPDSWASCEPGLIHVDSSSIEDFTILQKILRKDDLQAALDDESISSRTLMSQSYHSFDNKSTLSISALGLADIDLSPGDPVVTSFPMVQLELLFREGDPDRRFAKLRRITSGSAGGSSSKNPGLWTNVDTIRQLQDMVETAELEERLRKLKLSIDEAKGATAEYATLLSRRKMLKKNMPNSAASPLGKRALALDNSFDELSESSQDENKDPRAPMGERQREEQVYDEAPPRIPSEEQLEIVTHRMPHPSDRMPDGAPHNPDAPRRIPNDPDPEGETAAKNKKMRKSKRKFRPWFSPC